MIGSVTTHCTFEGCTSMEAARVPLSGGVPVVLEGRIECYCDPHYLTVDERAMAAGIRVEWVDFAAVVTIPPHGGEE